MKRTFYIIISIALITLLILTVNNYKKKSHTISVKGESFLITLTVKQKGDILTIESTMKNITKDEKRVTFNEPCNRGVYYFKSDNFYNYYESLNGGCISVLDEYVMKPNETLISKKEFKKKKAIIWDNVYIYINSKEERLKFNL